MRILFFFLSVLVANCLKSQDILSELSRNVPGQGTVVVKQSSAVAGLVGCKTSTSSKDGKNITASGYRIQLYAGANSRQSKEEAYRFAARARSLYPDSDVYTLFQSPRWLCQFGNFRTIEEADAMMRELDSSGDFKNMVIVRSPIIIKIEE